MAALLQDPVTGDLVLVNGNLALAPTVKVEATQDAQNAFGLWSGEWFLDENVGVPYMTQVLGTRNVAAAEQALKNVLLGVESIASVESFTASLDPTTRMLTVTWQATAIDGSTVTGSTGT